MLQIKNISKKYVTGELVQTALNDVSLNLRDNEFVAVLGPSGSGKTTLLNIIGGLDRYDSGDLVINEISTKKYKDRDWDSYRNHTIGFVFQSYNLIPHQTVLSNVELALTISGISRSERRKRAKEALTKVGLGNQLHKKPNQMSGGQMQRVAIARALVNNPDILLADEPTGALDSETSIQVMELLKEVAKDKLVVMVTHNPELACQYANRIVKLRDGLITDDSNPYEVETELKQPEHKNMGKSSMSFFTSLGLSFNNLKTKKGRTFLTAFAGSIGIIGIALILALSTGVNTYISDVQKETMASYPITIDAETIDMTSIMESMGGPEMMNEQNEEVEGRDGVYTDSRELEMENTMITSVTENDLTAFKKYLESPDNGISEYLGENGIIYSYDVKFQVYAKDSEGNIINTNMDTSDNTDSSPMSQMMQMMTTNPMLDSDVAQNFTELLPGANNAMVSQVTKDNYDLIYGSWPENYDEVVLVLNRSNAIATDQMYQLGIITAEEYKNIKDEIASSEDGKASELHWDYEEICNNEFTLVPMCDYYVSNEDGTFTYVGDNSLYTDQLVANGQKLVISGIIRQNEDADNPDIYTPVAYTSALTDHLIEYTDNSAVVKAQEAAKDTDVLTGLKFEAATDAERIENVTNYVMNLSNSEKASLYMAISSQIKAAGNASASDAIPNMASATDALSGMDGMDMSGMSGMDMSGMDMSGMSGMSMSGQMDEDALAGMLDAWLADNPDDEIMLGLFDAYLGDTDYDSNLASFGKISYDAPSSISIYTDSFKDKEAVSDAITDYNKTAGDDKQITYTDYVALLTSSVTSIVNVISYVLIAFVSVSLIVSCIMIGIITHISVLERTKEIGILRAIGASKKNISQVFNAETFIIGCISGLLGIGISELLIIPINAVIHNLTGMDTVNAILPIVSAAILIVISILITVIGGLLPAKKAAKKDPVIALRTE